MKRTTIPVTTLTGVENWVDSAGNQLVDDAGNAFVFNSTRDTVAILLTSPVNSLTLNVPERKMFSDDVVVDFGTVGNWVDDQGRQFVDSDGNVLVFNTTTAINVKPIVLTVPPSTANMTTE